MSTTGGDVVGCQLDVADTASLAAAADRAVAELGGLEIWVNNAAIFPTTGPAIDADDAFLDRMLQVNVRGTYAGAREAARRMSNGGVIVNLSLHRRASRRAPGSAPTSPRSTPSSASPRRSALEFGPLDIRVLAVAPTIIDTPGVRDQMAPLAASGVDVEARVAANPLGRMGVPDDVARVVLFCCSDMAAFMTGSTRGRRRRQPCLRTPLRRAGARGAGRPSPSDSADRGRPRGERAVELDHPVGEQRPSPRPAPSTAAPVIGATGGSSDSGDEIIALRRRCVGSSDSAYSATIDSRGTPSAAWMSATTRPVRSLPATQCTSTGPSAMYSATVSTARTSCGPPRTTMSS